MAQLGDFSPTKLKSVVSNRGGFATTEKYGVFFRDMPLGLNNSADLRDLSLMIEAVPLPTKSISGQDKFIYGTNYQMPYRQAFTEIAMTFYCTNSMTEKTFFDRWLNRIIDPITGDLKFYDNYTCNILIQKFDKTAASYNSRAVYEIELHKVWPSIVAEIQLSHAGGSEIAKLPVTFQYKKWTESTSTVQGSHHTQGALPFGP